MKTIERDEVFQNLKGFLKTKGIELQEGSYTRGIRHGCGILADTVNLSQRALARARTEMGKRLKQVRKVIHEKTGPPPVSCKPSPPPGANPNRARGRRRTARSAQARTRGSRGK